MWECISDSAQASELSDELEANFRNAIDKSGTESKRILASLSTRLKQDDKTLAGLETLVSGIKYRGNDASTVTRTNDLSAMLADYVAEEIRYRLDRLYLEAVQAGGTVAKAPAGETIAALEEELESLYPEIGILAEMSVRQQFNEPILREIQNEHGKLRVASQESLEQVRCSCASDEQGAKTSLGTRHINRNDIVQAGFHEAHGRPAVIFGAVGPISRPISIRSG
jgi:hypothetical protein